MSKINKTYNGFMVVRTEQEPEPETFFQHAERMQAEFEKKVQENRDWFDSQCSPEQLAWFKQVEGRS